MKDYLKKKFSSFSLDSVTILRGIACFIIVTIHAPLPQVLIYAPIGLFLTTVGFVAIYTFFFLSGFVLGKGFLNNKYKLTLRGILGFYGKRFLKIAPFYYLVVFYLFTHKANTAGPAELWRLLTFTAPEKIGLFSGSYLWFISTIMKLYLLAPLFFFGLKYLKTQKFLVRLGLVMTVLLLGAGIRLAKLPFTTYEYVTASSPMNLPIFVSGLILATVYTDLGRFLRSKRIFSLTVIASTFAFPSLYFLSFQRLFDPAISPNIRLTYEVIVVPTISFVLMALVLSLFREKVGLRSVRLLPLAVLQLVGVYSYEIYLLHQPLFSLLNLPCFLGCDGRVYLQNILVVTSLALVLAISVNLLWRVVKKTKFVRVSSKFFSLPQ